MGIIECKYIDGTKVAGEGGHIEKMRTLRKLANDAGANFDDTRFKTKLIDSFPKSWDSVSHGERVVRRDAAPSSQSDTVKALEANVLALQAEIKTLRSVRKFTPNPNKANLTCENKANCGKTGHLIEDCFQLGGGKQGQYPSWWKGKRTAPVVSVPALRFISFRGSQGHRDYPEGERRVP